MFLYALWTAIALWGIVLPSSIALWFGRVTATIHKQRLPVDEEKRPELDQVRIACMVCGSHVFTTVDNPDNAKSPPGPLTDGWGGL